MKDMAICVINPHTRVIVEMILLRTQAHGIHPATKRAMAQWFNSGFKFTIKFASEARCGQRLQPFA